MTARVDARLAASASADEVRDLVAGRPGFNAHVAYSRPRAVDRQGRDFDSEGHITGALIARVVGEMDAHYFVCGPTAFMAEIQADLERQGVPVEQIHTETFGPA